MDRLIRLAGSPRRSARGQRDSFRDSPTERPTSVVRPSLVRPDGSWPASAWPAQSAALQGIPRADLDAAPSAWIVAGDYGAMTRGRVALSDAPDFDGMWLKRLVDLAIRALEIDVRSFDAEAHRRFTRAPNPMERVY